MADVADLRAIIRAEIGQLQREFRNAADSVKRLERSSVRDLTKVNRQLDTVSRTATSFGRVFKAALAGIVTRQAVREIGRVIGAASDLNEAVNAAQVQFGSAAREVVAFSQTSANSLGIAASSALQVASNFGAIFDAAKLTNAESARLSIRMQQLAADLASVRNIRLEDALQKLQAGLVGEVEPLRRVGVLLDADTVKRRAVTEGIAKQGEELTQQQKILARVAEIEAATSKIQGDFANTSDQLANAQRRLTANLEDARAALGEAFLPAAGAVVAALADATKNTDAFREAGRDILPVVAAMAKTAVDLAIGFTATAKAISLAIRESKLLVETGLGPFVAIVLAAREENISLSEAMGAFSEAAAKNSQAIQDNVAAFDAEIIALGNLGNEVDKTIQQAIAAGSSQRDLASAAGVASGAIETAGEKTEAASKSAAKAEREYDKLAQKLGKELVEATRKASDELDELIENLRFEAATAGLSELDKEIAETRKEIEQLGLAAGLTATEIEEKTAEAVGLLIKRNAELGETIEKTAEQSSRALSSLGQAFEDMIAGIAAGTQELSFDGITDALKAALADSIKEKLQFDKLFQGNIFDLVGSIGDIILGNGGLTDIFSTAFSSILGGKGALDTGLVGAVRSGVSNASNQSGLTDLLTSLGLGGGAGGLAPGVAATLASAVSGGAAATPLVLASAQQAANPALIGSLTNPFVNTALVPTAGTGAAGATAGTGASSIASSATIVGIVAAVAGILGREFQTSSSPQVRGTGRFLSTAVTPLSDITDIKKSFEEVGQGLLVGGPVVSAILKGIGFDPFGGAGESQLSRRGITSQILRPSAALGEFFPEGGDVEFGDALKQFPALAKEAGAAATAFGAVLSQSINTGVSDSEELNFVFNSLIDQFGEMDVAGPEAIIRTAAAMRELGISGDQAFAILDRAVEEGRLSVEQYQAAVQGLGDITAVTVDEMVETIKGDFEAVALDTFNRLEQAGVESFLAVTLAANDGFNSIAANLNGPTLANFASFFAAVEGAGVSSAKKIGDAFWKALQVANQLGNVDPQFFNVEGKLIFGQVSGGEFQTLPAPVLTPEQQRQTRGSAIPLAQIGGFVERSGLAVIHQGEEIVTERFVKRLDQLLDRMDRLDRGGERTDSPTTFMLPVMEPGDTAKFIRRAKQTGHMTPINPMLGLRR